MRYAVVLPNAGPCADPRVAAELAVLAEESGWDGVFLEDYVTHHYAHDVPTGDPWVTLAAMAVRTERVVLATAVTPLSRRRPWLVARQSTSVDQLSGGRFVLGAGLGDTNDPGFAACGEPVDPRTRAAMLDEALTILDGLWSGQPFAFRGAHYRLDEVTFLPTPDQRSRVPVWIGGGYPREAVVRRALRWDGSCMYREPGPSSEWSTCHRKMYGRCGHAWTLNAVPVRRTTSCSEAGSAVTISTPNAHTSGPSPRLGPPGGWNTYPSLIPRSCGMG